MTKRSLTRTWSSTPVAQIRPLAQVQDPAVRDILLTRLRALLMEAAALARRCGLERPAGGGGCRGIRLPAAGRLRRVVRARWQIADLLTTRQHGGEGLMTRRTLSVCGILNS